MDRLNDLPGDLRVGPLPIVVADISLLVEGFGVDGRPMPYGSEREGPEAGLVDMSGMVGGASSRKDSSDDPLPNPRQRRLKTSWLSGDRRYLIERCSERVIFVWASTW